MNTMLKNNSGRLFDTIINSVSTRDIETTQYLALAKHLARNALSDIDIPDYSPDEQLKKVKNALADRTKTEITSASNNDTLKNIAYFARVVATCHTGWDWPEFTEQKNAFQSEIERLYIRQHNLPESERLTGDALLEQLFKTGVMTIADNHFRIYQSDGKMAGNPESWGDNRKGVKRDLGVVGDNLAYNPKDITVIQRKTIDLSDGSKLPLIIGEKKQGNETIGVIAFSTTLMDYQNPAGIQEQIDTYHSMLKTFHDHVSDWDHVVIDVRGNGGGDNFQWQDIADTLYGNTTANCMKLTHRDTPETRILTTDRPLDTMDTQTWTPQDYPFNGPKKDVYILTDSHTASAGEDIVARLWHHPHMTTVGQHTCGCCQYGGVHHMKMPNGGMIQIGTCGRQYTDGMIEVKGHQPKIDTTHRENGLIKGNDAYSAALNEIDKRAKNRQTLISKIQTGGR